MYRKRMLTLVQGRMAVLKHETSVMVNRPVEEVFSFVGAGYIENHARWDSGCVETVQTSDGPIGVGTTGREVRVQGGRRSTYDFKITEFDANRRLAFQTTSGPADFAGAFGFQPEGAGTRVTMSFQLGLRGLMRLMEPMIGGSFRKEMDAAAQAMKGLAEGQGAQVM